MRDVVITEKSVYIIIIRFKQINMNLKSNI